MQPPVPPFYENWDDTHCVQCVLRGVLESFEPNALWQWDELDAFTGKQPGKWTWPYREQINMVARGYEVASMSGTGVEEYLAEGIYEVFLRKLGKEAADRQREMADFDIVRRDMLEYKKLKDTGAINRQDRPATMTDIEQLIAEGYLINSSLNFRTLNNREGYASHSVLVYALEGDDVIVHDSGLNPAIASRRISRADFIAASTNPTKNQWNIRAYRKLPA